MEQNHRWLLLNKQSQHKIYVFKTRMNVGRSAAADIICYSDKISRNQAYITVDADGDLYVHDNKSVNGTFINGQAIEPNKLHKLKMLDEVGFGLHSGATIDEGRKYIYDVIDLQPKENTTNHNTEASTTKNDHQMLNPVVLLTDIKLEPLDKSKIQNSPAKSPKGYSIEDSVIVVDGSDDSDDDLGPCSELLHKGKTINSQNELGIGDSIFFEVKQELQDMEQGAKCGVVYVDDEYAHDPVSSNDLLALLEDNMRSESPNKIVVPQENLTKTGNHVTLNKKCVIKEGETSTATKKYVIPPIIPAHFEQPKSRKRRSTIEISTTKSKRSKSIDIAVKPSTKSKSIAENTELKDKLKAVAMKEKAKQQTLEKQKSSLAPAKVKVSKSRGNFLTKPLELKPNSTKKTAGLPHRVCSTFTNLPSTSTASANESINKSRSIELSFSNFKLSKTHENLQDILLQFLNWNPQWLNERKFNDTLPPINQKPLVQLLNSFKSYAEYYSIVLPHWMVELWYFFCKEYDISLNGVKKSFKAQLEKCTHNDKFIKLECFAFISKKDSDRGFHIKEEDVGLLDVSFENNEKHRGVYFGCISSMKKTILRNSSAIHHDITLLDGKVPHAVIDFNVLMKSKDIKSFKRTLEIHVFTNMVSTWRIFNSIKHLKHSLLCDHILKPNVQNYLQLLNKININTFNLDNNLNYSQKYAVAEATKLCLGSTPGIYLIQGPPGTGKSTVIVNIVKQILLANNQKANDQCILLVAPTNTAIDELLSKLLSVKFECTAEDRKKLKIVRFGPDNSIRPDVKIYSLNELTKTNLLQNCSQKFPNNSELIKIQNAITTLKSQLDRNPQIEVELNAKRELLVSKCRELYGRSYMSEFNLTERSVLSHAKIICTTLSSCVGTRMVEVFSNSTKISCCIVDEATYSKEQETFIPLTLGISKMVLVGDPKQLPGVTFSKEAKEFGHGNSLFSRLMENFTGAPKNPIRMLNVQYRMHPQICNFPNQMFYNGLLKTDPSVLKRKNPISTFLHPYLVFQMENNLKNINQQQEYQNDSETKFILTLVQAIVEILPKSHKINIGIITPYNVQKDRILRVFKDNNVAPNVCISVNTVDSFQGQEQDIIILSSVRIFSNNFLADNQRLNVSLTRAKYALYVIGTENLFKTCEIFGKLHRDSRSRNLLKCIPLTINVPHLTKFIKQNKVNK